MAFTRNNSIEVSDKPQGTNENQATRFWNTDAYRYTAETVVVAVGTLSAGYFIWHQCGLQINAALELLAIRAAAAFLAWSMSEDAYREKHYTIGNNLLYAGVRAVMTIIAIIADVALCNARSDCKNDSGIDLQWIIWFICTQIGDFGVKKLIDSRHELVDKAQQVGIALQNRVANISTTGLYNNKNGQQRSGLNEPLNTDSAASDYHHNNIV